MKMSLKYPMQWMIKFLHGDMLQCKHSHRRSVQTKPTKWLQQGQKWGNKSINFDIKYHAQSRRVTKKLAASLGIILNNNVLQQVISSHLRPCYSTSLHVLLLNFASTCCMALAALSIIPDCKRLAEYALSSAENSYHRA